MIYLEASVVAGTKLDKAASELVEMAKQLQCCIGTKFNGVSMLASPNSTTASVIEHYQQLVECLGRINN